MLRDTAEARKEESIPVDKGTLVRLKSDPAREGVLTGNVRELDGQIYFQVRFAGKKKDFFPDTSLEQVDEDSPDPLELIGQGKFGRARDLRGALTHMRLTGRLADVIYSMESTNTDFYAYQFKPVLNFLDSPSDGLLIADEVGLGKTIEAGLIWTELRARLEAKRLLVVCPAVLREKWQLELEHRFGVEAQITDAAGLLKALQQASEGRKNAYALICSMQGLRPGRGWRDNQEDRRAASQLARFIDDLSYQETLADLLIIDEAHYMRNAETATAELGRLLRGMCEHLVLLSATPVHLRSRDLYELLQLIDADTFSSPETFDEILHANAPLLALRDSVLSGNLEPAEFEAGVVEAAAHPLLRGSQQIKGLLNPSPDAGQLKDHAYRSDLAARLERMNLLGRAVTRTRKRDVHEQRVVREAVPEHVQMSAAEYHAYTVVTEIVREYAEKHEAHEGFLMVQPQRQMASSMAAAVRRWSAGRVLDAEGVAEEFGDDPNRAGDGVGPLVSELMRRVGDIGDPGVLAAQDSKYRRLAEMLSVYMRSNPGEKLILFATFKATLHYLADRLRDDGISAVVLTGDAGDEKMEVIDRFRDRKEGCVLLASEVASEGVDLQFCRVIINYDLPWNPMRVEQRIGRLDRIGQKSPRITIWNLFYADTIDERINDRLYQRLGIFEHALGGLEQILGEQIRKLTMELMAGHLTAAQEAERIEQTAQAVATLRKQEETLEAEAGNLIAHGDYIIQRITQAHRKGGWISAEELWAYVRDLFESRYPGTDMRQIEGGKLLFDFRLSEKARMDLTDHVHKTGRVGLTRLTGGSTEPVRVRFAEKTSERQSRDEELITQFHPVIAFVSAAYREEHQPFFPSVAVSVERAHLPAMKPGVYVFFVDRWSVSGLRTIEKLHMAAVPYSEAAAASPMDTDLAEQLISTAARLGRDELDLVDKIDGSVAAALAGRLFSDASRRSEQFGREIDEENSDRANLQVTAVQRRLDRQLQTKTEVLEKHRSLGRTNLVKATEGQIRKLTVTMQDRIRRLEQGRKTSFSREEVCMGLVEVR